MYGQIAQQRKLPFCSAVVDVAGHLMCDVLEMKRFINEVECAINLKINLTGS